MILEKMLDKVAARKEYEKAYVLVVATLVGMLISSFLFLYFFLSGNYIRGTMFVLSFIGMILLFFTFLKQYKTFKFLAMFSVGGVK